MNNNELQRAIIDTGLRRRRAFSKGLKLRNNLKKLRASLIVFQKEPMIDKVTIVTLTF